MVAPATGIKRGFYRAFAEHLAANGYATITFDNRGIGDSKDKPVAKEDASLQDWGQLDMPAVLDHLMTEFPNTTYHLIGHSAGGQLIGLMPNAHHIKSVFNFACSSGRLWNMHFPYILLAVYFMHVFIPISNLIFGHTKSQWVGMGEPLPSRVARQWTKWCSGGGYVATELGIGIKTHWYNDLTFPSIWLNATDDDIAINENVDDMTRVFSKISVERVVLNPKDHQLKEIGHMKFFSRKSQALWSMATDWLDKYSQ